MMMNNSPKKVRTFFVTRSLYTRIYVYIHMVIYSYRFYSLVRLVIWLKCELIVITFYKWLGGGGNGVGE